MPCACGCKQRYRGVRGRNLLTIAGEGVVPRRYFACACGQTHSPMDAWAGLSNRSVSADVRRLMVLAGSSWSFEESAKKLAEMCRIKTSNDTVRAICDEEGERGGAWMGRDKASVEPLKRVSGELEFSSDGTCVNTIEGWREMRLSVLSKRESAAAAEPVSWNDRVLPDSTARLAWSAIADSETVGKSWKRRVRHAGVKPDAKLSVIADGAKWIWEQAGKQLPGANAQWVLDVYHAAEHVHACGKAIFGEKTPAARTRARTWSDAQLLHLIEQGGPAFCDRLQQQMLEQTDPAAKEAIASLKQYLDDNRDRMGYRRRLADGRPIGSGLIEGGCKNTLGARLKLNAARWRPERAERMGHLRCLQYSDLWITYWDKRAA